MTALELKPLVVSSTCLCALFGDSRNPNYFQICSVCRGGFLKLDTIDIQAIEFFVVGAVLSILGNLSVKSGPLPIEAQKQSPKFDNQMSPGIAKGPWEAESPRL